MLEIVKLRAELGQRHRLPCHHIELLHLTGSQFIAEFLPEACLHASIASSVSSDGVTDVTAQCCSAARGPSAQMQRQLHVKTLHNKPNPGPGLVTRTDCHCCKLSQLLQILYCKYRVGGNQSSLHICVLVDLLSSLQTIPTLCVNTKEFGGVSSSCIIEYSLE